MHVSKLYHKISIGTYEKYVKRYSHNRQHTYLISYIVLVNSIFRIDHNLPGDIGYSRMWQGGVAIGHAHFSFDRGRGETV